MKKLLNIVILFFALTLSLLIEHGVIQQQPIETINYFQATKKETVTLVSNNLFNGEINSYQQKSDHNSVGSTPLILSYHPFNNDFNKNKTLLNGCFIHNLSTDNRKIHPIRAP